MTDTRLHEEVGERGEAVPYRGVEGLRITARSRGQRAPRNYVVRAPNGELSQLGEEEHFLLTILDGKRSFGEIQDEFRARFAGNLSQQHFDGFVDELRSAGIIERLGTEAPPIARPRETAAPLITIVEEAPPREEPPETDEWTGDVVPSEDTVPLYRGGATVAPLFMLLARLGSPLRFFVWFVPLAAAALGIALYIEQPRLLAALGGFEPRTPGAALDCIAAVLLALIFPNVVRGAVAAFHGAPRETFRLTLAGYFLPCFRIHRGWVRTLSRKAQGWTYGSAIVARLALFALGSAAWLFAADQGDPRAVAALLAAGVGLWSSLLTATPLWSGDGRRWIAVYFEEPVLDSALWRALRLDSIEAFERRGRDFVAVAAVLSLTAIAGALLLWGRVSWDGLLIAFSATWHLVLLGIGAVLGFASRWLGGPLSLPVGSMGNLLPTGAGLSSGFGFLGSETFREIGAALLCASSIGVLLWLQRAHARAGGLRSPVRGWDSAFGRALDRSPGGRAPLDGGPTDTLPPSLDERLYAGGQAWPSNTKVLVLAALIVVGLSVAFLSYPYESGGTFTILPYTSYEQDARVAGEITEVLVREGDRVNEGQILATMADWNEVHSLSVAKANLEKASAQLQDLLLLPKPEQVALARQQYEQAAARLPFSKADYERDLALLQTGAVSVRQFEQTQSTYEQDKAAVSVTKANYDLVRVGATQPEIESARAAVRLATAQVSYAEDQLARTRIRATASGTVITANPQLMYGKYLKLGQTFVLLQDNRIAHVEVQVPETDIRDIYVGSRVRAKAWGYERQTWLGKVTLIAHDATATQGLGNIVRVVAEIPNSAGLLRPQMSGYAKVQTVEMPVWISFTRAIVRFLFVEVWSWIP